MSGVEQGRAESGTSFEVMGLMVGKADGESVVGAISFKSEILAGFDVVCSTPSA